MVDVVLIFVVFVVLLRLLNRFSEFDMRIRYSVLSVMLIFRLILIVGCILVSEMIKLIVVWVMILRVGLRLIVLFRSLMRKSFVVFIYSIVSLRGGDVLKFFCVRIVMLL